MTAKHNGFHALFCLISPFILLPPLISFMGTCNGLQCYYGPSLTWIKQGIETCEPEEKWCMNYTCKNERGIVTVRGCTNEKPMKLQEYIDKGDKYRCGVYSAPAKITDVQYCDTDFCNKAGNNRNAGSVGQMIVGVCLLLVALILKMF